MIDPVIKQSPMAQRQTNPVESSQNMETLFSPRFKSVAAMAGWDEESILVASLIVEDTPDRQFKNKKRSDLNLKTPPSNSSRRKRRNQMKSPISVPVINLDEEKHENQENQKEKKEPKFEVEAESEIKEVESSKQDSGVSCYKPVLPCMDKLKEELSCAICLEICYEPSTTSCGHSFCKKCLRSAADKCGKKCPKCRQLISNGRSCTVNTVLWNTIQLLFPEEVEARKAAGASNSREEPTGRLEQEDARARSLLPQQRREGARRWRRGRIEDFGDETWAPTAPQPNARREGQEEERVRRGEVGWRLWGRDESGRSRRGTTARQVEEEDERSMQRENLSWVLERGEDERGRRRGTPSQDADAALALRLQREEFMDAFRGSNESSISLARANLRAMASRATNNNLGNRSRPTSFF